MKWKYDEDSELYTRYINDSVHVDEGNLAPVEASNVIVQFMSYKVLDDEGRIRVQQQSFWQECGFDRGNQDVVQMEAQFRRNYDVRGRERTGQTQ